MDLLVYVQHVQKAPLRQGQSLGGDAKCAVNKLEIHKLTPVHTTSPWRLYFAPSYNTEKTANKPKALLNKTSESAFFPTEARGANFWCEFFVRQPISFKKVCESYFVTFERDQVDGIAIIAIKSGHKLHWALNFFSSIHFRFPLEVYLCIVLCLASLTLYNKLWSANCTDPYNLGR